MKLVAKQEEKLKEPKVFVVARTKVEEDYNVFSDGGLNEYLEEIQASDWISNAVDDVDKLIEIGGRLCYKSFKPGLNKNVKKIREDNGEYIGNIIKSRHGSVMEHASVTFIFHNVSRVFTHELCRHRAGVAISQESLRYVRLTDLSLFDSKELLTSKEGEDLTGPVLDHVEKTERLMLWLSERNGS